MSSQGGKQRTVAKLPKSTVRNDEPSGDFMEKKSFFMRTMEENARVVALGDLWDCRTNSAVGNLFDKSPTSPEYLQFDPIESVEYDLYRCKTAGNKLNSLKVTAEMKLDVAVGSVNVNVGGSVDYDQSDKSRFTEDELSISFNTYTYQVATRPNVANIVSPLVKSQLISGAIVATHYVKAVYLGGQAYANVRFSENVSESNMKLDATISAGFKMTFGDGGKNKVDTDMKVTLNLLDTKYSEYFSTRISAKSQPRFSKTPTTVDEMFKEVENLTVLIEEQQHFPELGTKVCGVPIGFSLVPIQQILEELPVDPIFQIIAEEVLSDFLSMITTLQDFINPEYVKWIMTERQPVLSVILRDKENPLTKEVTNWSNQLILKARKLKNEAFILYGAYKMGNKTEEHLKNFLTEYDSAFDILSVMSKIQEFVARGKKELIGIRASDVVDLMDEWDEPTIRFFSNELDLEEWYNPERTIKVLLRTDQTEGSPSGVFLKLFDMSSTLKRHGVEVGVAFPNISQDFSLTFKTSKSATTYSKEEIPFLLEVLGLGVDEGESISTLFYSLNASLSGLYLPMVDHLDDIPSLLTLMKEYQGTRICETYVQLLSALTETTGTWNFVLPLQALNTGIEMIRFFRQLKKLLPERFPKVEHRWLMSKLNGTNHVDSPLIFIFKDDVLQAVCMDQCDILILVEQLAKPIPDLSIISYKRMKESSLYTPRVDFATDVIQNLILDHPTWISDPMEPWSMYPFNPDKALEEAMRFVRAACTRDEPSILTCVALQAIAVSPELEGHLVEYGWKERQFQRSQWNKNDWGEFLQMLNDRLGSAAPFLMNVVGALKELRKIPVDAEAAEIDSSLEEIIKFLFASGATRKFETYAWRGQIINNDEIFKDLKEEVASYEDLPAESRKIAITNAFQGFYDKTIQDEEYFYLVNMITLVEALAVTLEEGRFATFKHTLNTLAKKYCALLSINDKSADLPDVDTLRTAEEIEADFNPMDEYPQAWRKIQEALARRQLFKVLDILAQIRYHPLLYLIHQELYNLTALPAPTALKSIFEKLAYPEFGYFEEGRLEVIWNNPKFLYLLRQVMDNDGVLGSLYVFISTYDKLFNKRAVPEVEEDADVGTPEDEIDIHFPKFVPSDIVEKVRPLFGVRKGPIFNWLKEWPTLDIMIQQFQIICTRKQLPLDFPQVLQNNIQSVKQIHDFMKKANCLYFWDEENAYFTQPWSILMIQKCLTTLLNAIEGDKNGDKPIDLPPINDRPKAIVTLEDVKVNEIWRHFTKLGTLPSFPTLDFLQLERLRPLEMIEYDELDSATDFILPYVLQQTKMLNTNILKPSVVSKFVNYPLPGLRPGQIDFGEGIPNKSLGLVMTRSDIQTALLYTAQPFIIHQVLDSMIKGHIALPLIVPDITDLAATSKAQLDAENVPSVKFLFPSLQSLIVPEMEGLVPQPHLFQTPFRFVVTLRVGKSNPDLGRSSLINQFLMKDPNMFSSWNEPGKTAGRSLARKGLLEFTWLSQTTCNEKFWNGAVLPEYKSQRKEMILLGNLHGDATQLSSFVELLQPLVSCYVVFWRATNWTDLKAKKKLLAKVMTTADNTEILDVVLYPDSSISQQVHEQNLILKSDEDNRGSMAVNEAKLHRIFKEAIRGSVKPKRSLTTGITETGPATSPSLFSFGTKGPKVIGSTSMDIKIQDELATPESHALLQLLQTASIERFNKSVADGHTEGTLLKQFFQLFHQLIDSSSPSRLNGLLHFTYELDYLSRKTSANTVERIRGLRANILDRYRKEETPDERWVLESQDEIKMYLEQLKFKTLSLQHIFRTLNTLKFGQGYIPNYYHYIDNGFPVELLHPTYGNTMFQTPLREIFMQIPVNTRIFVISIVGLKESGKSRLLNTLFGTGFTQHSSTFGLQMRLLYLKEELRTEMSCDAFLVIDSEGVGAPENKVDAGADVWERRLVTFLLGLSDLTLVNTLGAGMDEMGPILEVAVTGLCKINQLAVQPDFFVIQQQLPGEISLLEMELTSCLEETRSFSESRAFRAGIRVPQAHRLKIVKSRMNHDEVIHKIRPFGDKYEEAEESANYHEDVQTLYSKILDKCYETRRFRQTFRGWYKFSVGFWNETQSVDLNHSSIRTLENELDLQDRILQVKQAIDEAFAVHEKLIDQKLNGDTLDQIFGEDDEGKPNPLNLTAEIEKRMINDVEGELKKVINSCTINASATKGKGRLRTMASAPISPDACTSCARAYTLREALFAEIVGRKRGFVIEDDINFHVSEVRDSVYNKFQQLFYARQIRDGKYGKEMYEFLSEVRSSNDSLEQRWKKVFQLVSTKQTVIPPRSRVDEEVQEVYKSLGHVTSRHLTQGDFLFPQLDKLVAFDVDQYNAAVESSMNAPKEEMLSWMQHDWLVTRLEDIPPNIFKDYDTKVYKLGMTYEVQRRVQRTLELFEEYCGEALLPNFMWEAHLYGIQLWSRFVEEKQMGWDWIHNPLTVLIARKEDSEDSFFDDIYDPHQ